MNIFSNVGIVEIIFILLLALLVFGPERLPEMAQKLAKTLRDVRKIYENLSSDLGPELASLQKTTQELRESVNSVRSIPQDTVKTIVEAAGIEEATAELKDTVDTLQEAGKAVTAMQETIKHPLRETAAAARAALTSTEPAQPEAGPDDAETPSAGTPDAPTEPDTDD